MRAIPPTAFTMGSDRDYPEERPARPARTGAFLIDETAVTNERFAAFVAATGYTTVAEQAPDADDFPGAPAELLVPGSLVFHRPSGPVEATDFRRWWRWVPGASWRHPEGPGSDLEGRRRHPVVQVSWKDATAYAEWAGKALPSEVQWEAAARGGLEGAAYAWGDEFMPDGAVMANTWHGRFPWENLAPAGVVGTMAVGSFPPNGHGLFDVCGNVWEWTRSGWTAGHADVSAERSCCGAAPSEEAAYVIKGGSWLCAPSYCRRYRPAARQPQTPDSATNHLGFRCVA